MAINVSDYNRSGVFIEERNNSVIDRPAAQEAVINFVPGFSRKGTVFNRPVYIKNPTDRQRYFGDIDRFLEKKQSFFHRTIDVATQTAPVWALNLLKTTSLDELNYKSVSVSAQYDNDVIKYRQYDDFFNKAGFWQRDVESFLFFAQNNERMIHFTNLSDKPLSVFMFKSERPGFDITAENWYGGRDKVPTWMKHTDLISDYMVRVVVVRGDWSNYVQLAVDPKWSNFFNTNGLRKNQIDNFINNNQVTLLGDYNGSLIPYFRDANNNNIFIETMINIDTDRTGLFATYDIDKVETDFATGVVDIIGHSLVGKDKSKIDFMSYQDTIKETDNYTETSLDRLGNVIGIGSIGFRNSINSNGKVYNITESSTLNPGPVPETAQFTLGLNPYVIISNQIVDMSSATTSFALATIPGTPNATETFSRIDTFFITDDGEINMISGTIGDSENAILPSMPNNYPNNAIVLGYVETVKDDADDYTSTYNEVCLNSGGYVDIVLDDGAMPDGEILLDTTQPLNVLDFEFLGTGTIDKSNYAAYRLHQFYNELVAQKQFGRSVVIGQHSVSGDIVKIELTSSNWSDNSLLPTGNRRLTITVDPIYEIQTILTNFVMYYIDDEFVVGEESMESRLDDNLSGSPTGIVAKHSELYQDYYNGRVNTGDYFYSSLGEAPVRFLNYTDVNNPTLISGYVILSTVNAGALNLSTGVNILTDEHTVNNSNYTLGQSYLSTDPEGALIGLAAGEIAFKVSDPVATTVYQTINVYDFDAKVYLKMYLVGEYLYVAYRADNELSIPATINNSLNTTIKIYSGEASYEQTLEIEQHPNYTMTDTKFLIDAVRYPEVRVGDYVLAYVDEDELMPNEYANRFARIIKKTPWSENATYGVQYSEITTDVKYDVRIFGNNDMQTQRYTKIQNYIDTLKAIKLGGFTPQATSIPDGTETRQNEILNIVQKDSPLYNAIVNKDRFNFRYLIDSFGNGLTEFSKQQLADICGKRKNCIGFLNMPSAKAFKNSSSPSFINVDGTLNLEYVKDGGNLDQNPPFLYSFADGSGKDDGRDTVGYFFPYVTVNDNGRPLSHPPAAFVANTYTRKLNSTIAGIYNWTVAAGVEDGLIRGVSNVEMEFTEKDLEYLYTMGANPIVYTKNIGFNIETEWTALRQPISSLSFLHSREVLIDLENELYAMLLKYRWKFNTAAIRAKIKREADAICQTYVDRSALYAFRNVIDETNNTPTLIDNQFGLLETYVEIVKAMGIIVNIINVQATGDIGDSTGFQLV